MRIIIDFYTFPLRETYHKLFEQFLSWCLDMVTKSGHSP